MKNLKSAIAGTLAIASLQIEPAVATASLTTAEQRVTVRAESEGQRAIQLLETLVNINSGTMNLEGVTRVGQVMLAELQALGFETRWLPMTHVGRAGHVLAEHKGRAQGRRILLIGHLDTVFERDSPFQRFTRHGEVAEGPGVNDMKDGLAIMVAALRAMSQAGTLKNANIIVVLSGDEENVGKPVAVSRSDMIAAAARSDVALEFEALAQDEGRDMGTISRRSSSTWTLRTNAPSGHSSGIFSADSGFGAAYELARILDSFRRDLREPNATYNVGLVLGGSSADLNQAGTGGAAAGKSNVIPAAGFARGDLRTLSNEQTQRLKQRMQSLVAQHLPGTQATIEFEESYPAMPPTEGNRRLLEQLNDINRALGLAPMQPLDPLKRGAGDIAFVADKVDALVGFGAVGNGSHAPGETVDLTSFDRQIKRTALLMTRLSRERR